jgi:hypothetical protein
MVAVVSCLGGSWEGEDMISNNHSNNNSVNVQMNFKKWSKSYLEIRSEFFISVDLAGTEREERKKKKVHQNTWIN